MEAMPVHLSAYIFKQVASKGLLAPKQGVVLRDMWKEVFEWAMTSRNDLHDELCDHKGVNVDVDEAVNMAEDCGVACLVQQKDLSGSPKRTLAEWLHALLQRGQRTYYLFFSSGRPMFLICERRGNLYFLDSHLHKDRGALITNAPSGSGEALADWIDKMMILHWNCPLTIGTFYIYIYSF